MFRSGSWQRYPEEGGIGGGASEGKTAGRQNNVGKDWGRGREWVQQSPGGKGERAWHMEGEGAEEEH